MANITSLEGGIPIEPSPSRLSFTRFKQDDELNVDEIDAAFKAYKEKSAAPPLKGRTTPVLSDHVMLYALKIKMVQDPDASEELKLFAALDLLKQPNIKKFIDPVKLKELTQWVKGHLKEHFSPMVEYCQKTENSAIFKLLASELNSFADHEVLELLKTAVFDMDLLKKSIGKDPHLAVRILSLSDFDLWNLAPKERVQEEIKKAAIDSIIEHSRYEEDEDHLDFNILEDFLNEGRPSVIRTFLKYEPDLFFNLTDDPDFKQAVLADPKIGVALLDNRSAPWHLRLDALRSLSSSEDDELEDYREKGTQSYYQTDIGLHVEDPKTVIGAFKEPTDAVTHMIDALSLLKFDSDKLEPEDQQTFQEALRFVLENGDLLKELVSKEAAIAAYVLKSPSPHLTPDFKILATQFLASLSYEDSTLVVRPGWHGIAHKVMILFKEKAQLIGMGGFGTVNRVEGKVFNTQTQMLKKHHFAVKTFHEEAGFRSFKIGNEALKQLRGARTSSKQLGGITKPGMELGRGRQVVYSAKGGDVFDSLTGRTPHQLNSNQLMMGFIGVAAGMKEALAAGLVNSDIKLENILYDVSGPLARMTWIDHDDNFLLPPRVSDPKQREAYRKQFSALGALTNRPQDTKLPYTLAITPKWYLTLRENVTLLRQIPEIANYDAVTKETYELLEKLYVFQLGVTLYTAFSRQSYAEAFNTRGDFAETGAPFADILKNFPPDVPGREATAQLIADMLSLDPDKTPSMSQVLARLEVAGGTDHSTLKAAWANRDKGA